MCSSFQVKKTALTFSAQVCPKMNLVLKIQKTGAGIRISILEILCMTIFTQNENFDILRPNLPKNRFWGRNS